MDGLQLRCVDIDNAIATLELCGVAVTDDPDEWLRQRRTLVQLSPVATTDQRQAARRVRRQVYLGQVVMTLAGVLAVSASALPVHGRAAGWLLAGCLTALASSALAVRVVSRRAAHAFDEARRMASGPLPLEGRE